MGQLAAEYGSGASGSGRRYVTSDYLGSARLVTKADGTVEECPDYLPFGERVPGNWGSRPGCAGAVVGGNPLSFTGQYRDAESGLDYFGARYLGPALGRFTSPDAPLLGQRPDDPTSWNLFGYARDNPLLLTDPTGRTYMICNTQNECGFYTDDEYADLTKNKNYVVAGGRICERKRNGTVGRQVGTSDQVDVDVNNAGAVLIRGVGERADDIKLNAGKLVVLSAALGASLGLAPAIGQAANEAVFGPSVGRLFWSGGQEAAKAAGAAGAGRLLEETRVGVWLEANAARYGQTFKNLAWEIASRLWASGAAGTVNVYAPSMRPGGVLVTTELPRLLSNPNVFKPLIYK